MAVRIAGWNTKHQTRNCFSCHADFCCVCTSASSYTLRVFDAAFCCHFLSQCNKLRIGNIAVVQNTNLNMEVELNTAYTNVEGFIRMVDTAFIYFRKSGGGHLAVISSIAGTKGLGVAPAYSATKRFQNTYIDALEQLSYLQKLNIRFTDIRPGFVATDLLNDGKHYPLLMDAAKVGRHIAWSLERKQRIVVIDWRYRILVFFWKMIPRWMWKRLPVKTN